MKPEVGMPLYAVTDQSIIIDLIVASVHVVDDEPDYLAVDTKLVAPEGSGHAEAHYKAYFKRLYVYKGDLQQGTVFLERRLAEQHSYRRLCRELATAIGNVSRLETQVRLMEAQYDVDIDEEQ